MTRRRSRWRSLPVALRLAIVIFGVNSGIASLVLTVIFYVGYLSDPSAVEGIDSEPEIIASLRRTEQGRLLLDPNDALRRRMARNPTFRALVIDSKTGEVAAGSEPSLVALYGPVRQQNFDVTRFNIDPADTPAGPVLVVVYATDWVTQGVWAGATRVIRDLSKTLIPLSLAAAVASALVIRRAFRPMQAVAREMSAVNIDSLGMRVTAEHVPPEVRDFARAVNDAIARIESDVVDRGRFIANAAHELRTPLSVMGARVELLPEGDLRRDLVADLERLSRMIRQMLAVARYGDSGHPCADTIDLTVTVRLVVARLAPLAVSRGRAIAVEARDAPAIIGNAEAIESALTNVIDNAVEAEPPGGTVEVRVGPGAVVIVDDHGPGFAPADRVRAFEPFWRGTASRSGSGLGLAIVRAAMALHAGTATIEQAPGGGARIILRFGTSSEPSAGPADR